MILINQITTWQFNQPTNATLINDKIKIEHKENAHHELILYQRNFFVLNSIAQVFFSTPAS